MAIGQMGMSLDTYLELTPYQFRKAHQYFVDRVKTDREHAELTAWKVARWQVWRTLCPPQQKQISITDLIELPGDKGEWQKKRVEQSSSERFRELTKKWNNNVKGI